jgi:hypothetical protein
MKEPCPNRTLVVPLGLCYADFEGLLHAKSFSFGFLMEKEIELVGQMKIRGNSA